MKRFLSLILALTMGAGMAFSAPVNVQTAKEIGQKFAKNNFEFGRANAELNLAYTSSTAQGEACYYLFNVGEEGFVIVSATDALQPILAYSYQNAIDVNNMSPALKYFLDTYEAEASYVIENNIEASLEVAKQWESIRNTGFMNSQKAADSFILLETLWDQDNPYNSQCPTCVSGETGPGGRAYAGCVACAMSQTMRYWNHPYQGSGSHSYQPGINDAGHAYPSQSVNFGNTIYDWSNMPLSLSSSSSSAEINAVAKLMYHCAVSVDMNWGGYEAEGSGSNMYKAANALKTYFDYTTACEARQKSADATWIAMLKEQLDRGWPVPYAGGGHAFVADGYDADNLIHFNLGWSGSGDGFYSVASLVTSNGYDFTSGQNCVINAVPSLIYSSTPKAPTNFTATVGANNALTVALAWKNPSQFLNNTSISMINQIVVKRNGQIVHTENNATPGANMSWTDNVPCFTTYDYEVYAIVSDNRGGGVRSTVYVGPTCEWTIMLSSNVTAGFRDGYIAVVDAAGNEYGRYTTATSSLTTIKPQLPLGNIKFEWHKPSTNVSQVTIIIKNAQNTNVFSQTNTASDDIPANLFAYNNRCDASVTPSQATNLVATNSNNDVTLNWTGARDLGYGYNIYKDDVLMALVTSGTTYTYNEPVIGGHCYYITVLTDGGEGAASNTSCVQIDPNGVCCPATDLYCELTSSNKVKLFWTKPACANFTGSKCGYYIYKKELGGDWTYVMKGANTTTYTDNSVQYGVTYCYKVVAIYNANTDDMCMAMPANVRYSTNKYVLEINTDAVAETSNDMVSIYPNPAKDKINVKGSDIQNVTVYNVVGQVVYRSENTDNVQVIDLSGMTSGIYMVKVDTANGETVKRISVVR